MHDGRISGGPSVTNLEGFSAWNFIYHFPVESYDTLKLKFARKKEDTEQQIHAQSFHKFVEESSQRIWRLSNQPVSWNKKNMWVTFEGL